MTCCRMSRVALAEPPQEREGRRCRIDTNRLSVAVGCTTTVLGRVGSRSGGIEGRVEKSRGLVRVCVYYNSVQ